MTNGQEKEGRHEKCPYVDVKYVVSGTMRKENQNRYWLAYGLVSRLEELHQRTGGRTDPFSDVSDGFLMGEHTCPERGVRKRECIMRGRVAFRRKPVFGSLTHLPAEPGDGLMIR